MILKPTLKYSGGFMMVAVSVLDIHASTMALMKAVALSALGKKMTIQSKPKLLPGKITRMEKVVPTKTGKKQRRRKKR